MADQDLDVLEARLALDAAFEELHKIEEARSGITRQPPICSFCGKGTNQVDRMLAGFKGAYICNECILLLPEILAGRITPSSSRS